MKHKYIQKIVKYFDSTVQETLLNLRNKTNYFFKKKKKINNYYKVLIGTFSLLLLYLFYISIPSFYDKTWVQNTIENKIIEDFKIDFSLSSNIVYNILPSPHFVIKDVKIFVNYDDKDKKISEIKKLRVFIDQKNFFNKQKFNISKVIIYDANFLLQNNDISLLNKASHKKFSNKIIKIHKGNIFFKDNENKIIAITKIKFASLFYDDLKKLNLLNLDGEVFNIPFKFNLKKDFSSSGIKEINLKAKKLKLKINDKLKKTPDDVIEGINTLSFLNFKTHTKYNIDKDSISFEYDISKIQNSNMDYKGKLLFDPFELKLDIDLKKYDLFKLFNFDSIKGELFKSELLFNERLSTNISINIASNRNKEIFSSTSLKLNIINGKINFDKTTLVKDDIGVLKIDNSHLFFENNNLILSSDVIINIQNSEKLFSFFQTSKKLRKLIKKIIITFDYDLVRRQLNIKKIIIDGIKSNNEMLDITQEISDIENYNLIKSKRMFNKIFSAYAG